MNRRLQQFLEVEKLAPARLADIMGLQRSGISHILSGRNKPSYEFIRIFLNKFPKVNATWLITGDGKMYSDSSPASPPAYDHDYTTNDDLFSSETTPSAPIFEELTHNKEVKRITLYYSDGSFKDFYPSK